MELARGDNQRYFSQFFKYVVKESLHIMQTLDTEGKEKKF